MYLIARLLNCAVYVVQGNSSCSQYFIFINLKLLEALKCSDSNCLYCSALKCTSSQLAHRETTMGSIQGSTRKDTCHYYRGLAERDFHANRNHANQHCIMYYDTCICSDSVRHVSVVVVLRCVYTYMYTYLTHTHMNMLPHLWLSKRVRHIFQWSL